MYGQGKERHSGINQEFRESVEKEKNEREKEKKQFESSKYVGRKTRGSGRGVEIRRYAAKCRLSRASISLDLHCPLYAGLHEFVLVFTPPVSRTTLKSPIATLYTPGRLTGAVRGLFYSLWSSRASCHTPLLLVQG